MTIARYRKAVFCPTRSGYTGNDNSQRTRLVPVKEAHR
jgi:hypothetical protein